MSEAGGSGREELNRYPLPSPAVLWIVNARERKPREKKKMTDKALQQHNCLIFWKLYENYQNKALGHGVIFWYNSNKNIFLILLQSHVKIALCPRGLRIVGWRTEDLNDWMKYEWLNDCTVTGYRISIYEKTRKIKFETNIYQGY